MKRQSIAAREVLLILSLMSALAVPATVGAQTMDQYYAQPPFVGEQVKPNILILMDNSGSMSERACFTLNCGTPTPPSTAFSVATTYNGLFDPMKCYTYDTALSSANQRFEPVSGNKATINTACSSTQWDGNFLNWATFRRFDAVKKAMIGGECYTPTAPSRNADGTCVPYTTASSKRTITGQRKYEQDDDGFETSPNIPNGTYQGRLPLTTRQGGTGSDPANLNIHVRGGTAGMQGSFCVDNGSSALADNTTSCSNGSGFTETRWWIRVAVDQEPSGVIQQIGSQARFGLSVFNNSNNGMQVLTGIGLRQSINFNGTSLETFTTNAAAMVDSVDESFPATNTPLAETLYEAMRYVAQVNSSLTAGSYVYPIAFSTAGSSGVALAASGIGSLGGTPAPGEIDVLTGSETCPGGYIASACGRDPYFYGSDHTPPWATTSLQVKCCKTYMILFTDGQPTSDTTVPATINTFARQTSSPNIAPYDGILCTGSFNPGSAPFWNDPPDPNNCNAHSSTPNNVLLKQHKTDYGSGSHFLDDVAYWGHIRDLRPCSGTADAALPDHGSLMGHCLPGLQNVSVYTFYAFGNIAARELLMHTALLGGFEDSNGNDLPDLTSEWDKVNNQSGAAGADGIPDAYFESSNVDDLQERLLATIAAILRKSASGTSISVLATSSTGEGSIYQAYFYTSDAGEGGASVKWTGYTHSLFIDQYGNFREDLGSGGNPDGRLRYADDPIITTRYDNDPNSPNFGKVMVDKYDDVSPADGKADTPLTPSSTSELKLIKPVWEAGRQLAELTAGTGACTLANAGVSCRRILTWVDTDNDRFVDGSEWPTEFITANSASISPYLRAGAAPYTAGAIINFIRGCEPTDCADQAGLRFRQTLAYAGGPYKTWKMGDPIHSTPTVVAAPRERYDVIYGDAGYRAFYQLYRYRREVVYVGTNDGMLHAFNGGFYHKGDDPSTTGSTEVEHGWFTKNPTDNTSGKKLGTELWGYIPYELLPQLLWLTRPDYTHVYYVDLKPKVTDAAIFCETASTGVPAGPGAGKCIDGQPGVTHPGGWGTILIGGFRMGGSCGNCASGSGAPPMVVGGRNFYSAYFVLDVTDPESDPKLLWSFSDANLGLTTSFPTVVRVNPLDEPKTSNVKASWFALFGSGPNGYEAELPSSPAQTSRIYSVDLAKGPRDNGATSNSTTYVTTFAVFDPDEAPSPPTPETQYRSFMGPIITMDRDLDFRVDVAYAGRTIHDGSLPWRGKLERLTTPSCATGTSCDTSTWGQLVSGNRGPTEVLALSNLGPITAAPTVTTDDTNYVWLFAGTGRYYSNSDKTDTAQQFLFGVKDLALSGCNQGTPVTGVPALSVCASTDLVDVTAAVVCLICATGTDQVTGITGVTKLDDGTGSSMVGLVQSKHGWYIAMSTSPTAERSVSSPTLIGGTVFFPTFQPTQDFCASSGTSYLYALFYKTGTAYTSPIIGTDPAVSGTTNIKNKITLGDGLASQMSLQIGAAGSGGLGSSGGGNTTGCAGGITGAIQMGAGNVTKPCVRPATSAWSQYISWMHERG